MFKKSFLNSLLIMLAGWIPLSKNVHAYCQECTAEQKKSCTDVNISYGKVPGYSEAANWTANMWYTRCGEQGEAGLPFYARGWDNNHCCVQSGTRIRIGPQGENYSPLDQTVTGPNFHAVCWGTIGQDGSDMYYANCSDASKFPLPCTSVTVNFDPGPILPETIIYTPCMGSQTARSVLHGWNPDYYPNTFLITSGTRVQIGPQLSSKTYIDEELSGIKVNVRCYGDSQANGGCCVAGSSSCPKASVERKMSAPKAPVKTSSETRAPEKTPHQTKTLPKP